MNKTGTSSLRKCFKILGLHPIAPALPSSPESSRANWRLFEQEEYEPALRCAEKYRAFEDRPWNVWEMYKHLDSRFPDSAFILTVRDPHAWWRSVQRWVTVVKPWMAKTYRTHLRSPTLSQDDMISGYLRYNREVMHYFEGNENLLVMDMEKDDGWEPLCAFLGCPVPQEPFPHENRLKYDERDIARKRSILWRRRLRRAKKTVRSFKKGMIKYFRFAVYCISPLIKRAFCFHVFPEYIIIGAQKGGTAFLHGYLGKHPHIKTGKWLTKHIGKWKVRNEIHFFDDNHDKGLRWYRSKFSISPFEYLFKRRGTRIVCGEKTPEYLCHPSVPERVFRALPDVKLILLLRNPIDRAYSHYLMEVRKNGERRSFGEFIDSELDDFLIEKRKTDGSQSMTNESSNTCRNILSRGIYIVQIERWMEYFPLKHFKIIKSEDLFEYPLRLYKEVLDFLALPGWEPGAFVNRKQRYYETMRGDIRQRLKEFYNPYNERLYELLGRDLHWD